MYNQDVRGAIVAAGLRYWQVAAAYGCTDGTFSRKLRRELPAEEKQRIFDIIAELSKNADCQQTERKECDLQMAHTQDNNEKFNDLLNSCSDPWRTYNYLMAFAKPSLQQSNDVSKKRQIIIGNLLALTDKAKSLQ